MDAHKDPADRAHLWDRPTMPHEQAPAADVAPGTTRRFPTTVYRESTNDDQPDHPGHEAKVVGSQEELDAHLANGWHASPQDEYPAVAQAPVA